MVNRCGMTEEVPENQKTDAAEERSERKYKQTNLIVLVCVFFGTMFLLLVPGLTNTVGGWLISLFK